MGHFLSKEPTNKSEVENRPNHEKEESQDEKLLSNPRWSDLTKDLSLNGKSLQLPQIHHVNWKNGQTFSSKEDPDRMQCEWNEPKFVSEKDPLEQKEKVVVEEIDLESIGVDPNPNKNWPYHSFAKIIHNILTPEECEELLISVNEKGFTPALLNIGSGMQQYSKCKRDGNRCLIKAPELTSYIFRILEDHLPSNICAENGQGGMDIVELNEMCRFLLYTPGQKFPAHRDGCFVRPANAGEKAGELSRITIQMYLHDVPEDFGGATTFIGPKKEKPCQPKCGSALIFTQNLFHEGSLVKKGIKYTMRTEVMYRPKPISIENSATQ